MKMAASFQETCTADTYKPGLVWGWVNIPAGTLAESSILYTQSNRWTDRQADSSIPLKTLILQGYNDQH